MKIQGSLVILLFYFSAFGGSANEQIGSYMNEYYELLALAGIVERPALIYHSLSRNTWQLPPPSIDHPWKVRMEREKDWGRSEGVNWNVISPALMLSYNTSYALGSNDGSIWQGKGVNSRISGGMNLDWKWISATLAPELWFARNKEFDLMPSDPSLSEYSYPNWRSHHIDMPQRFGDDPVIGYGLGQSDVRVNIDWFTLGFSTENLWFGPAQVNPILMSHNASGFPHADVGIRKVNTFLGDIEFNLVWGALVESDYFDDEESNDYRLFSSLTFGYRPFFLESLTLGFARVMYTTWANLSIDDFTVVFNPLVPGLDDRDQMLSFIIDWLLPKATFNAYLEWARNDYSPDLRWALSYPQHSQGYTVGFRKLISLNQTRFLSITAEITELVRSKDADEICPSYYRHYVVTQGYTHLGQVMGAAIGPGSNTQFLGVDYYASWGKASVFFQRIGYDHDYYLENFDVPDNENVKWTAGVGGVVFLSPLDIKAKLALSDNWNRNYEKNNDVWNLYGMVSLTYHFQWNPRICRGVANRVYDLSCPWLEKRKRSAIMFKN
jgi:hypothetical protein